jgi:hypothetical protein
MNKLNNDHCVELDAQPERASALEPSERNEDEEGRIGVDEDARALRSRNLTAQTTMARELFQAIAGDLLGLDWGLRALVRMPEP